MKPNSCEIGICFLQKYDCLESAIMDILGSSKSAMKKLVERDKRHLKNITPGMEVDLPLNLINLHIISGDYDGEEVGIVFEDENFLVMDKPPFIHSHPHSYSENDNCLSFLRNRGRHDLLKVNGGRYDRGLLNRLDFETSGVLVYVKREELHRQLRENFSRMVRKKIYFAIVEGNFQKEGTHSHLLKSSFRRGGKMKVTSVPGKLSLKAMLEVRKISHCERKNVSLVKVHLQTGVRHQIRAQLSSLGHPIVGDVLYGGTKDKRIYLHAYFYEIHLGGKVYSFRAPGPLFFDRFFDQDRCPEMFV